MGRDLYVRSISTGASAEELRKLFSVCGTVTHVHLVKDAGSGAFAGCAFVKMASEAEANDAIVTLDGALLHDRTIVVSAARPQRPKPRPVPGGKSRPR